MHQCNSSFKLAACSARQWQRILMGPVCRDNDQRHVPVWFEFSCVPPSVSPPMSPRVPFASLSAAMALLLSACSKPAIETYRAPKDPAPVAKSAPAPHNHGAEAPKAAPAAPAPAAATGSTMANTPVATSSGPGLAWSAPASWIAKPGSAMRKGSYAIKGDGGEADLSITAFPGDVGGDLANINRWRGQIQLGPISAGDLASAVQRLERNGLKIGVVDLGGATGPAPQRTLAAMVPHEGSTWFFKLTGPDALVAKEKAAFMAFLDTVKPSAQ